MGTRPLLWLLAGGAVIGALLYSRSVTSESVEIIGTPRLHLITGGPDAFQRHIEVGARAAAERYGVDLTIHVPEADGSDQTRKLLKIDLDETDGIAITPMEPEDQTRALSLLAAKTKVLTFDNDAPLSSRIGYVGTNNWTAGQLCADLVMEALPEGGKIALFVGDHVRDNARHRRQGLIAALDGKRPQKGQEYLDLMEPIQSGKYTVVGTYLDDGSLEKAKANAAKTIAEYPDLAGMVALYGYNGPMCLEALKEAGKQGKIKLITFDEHEATLEGIATGNVSGTVVQDPYRYGYETIRILAELCRVAELATPAAGNGSVFLPCSIVNKENLEKFRATLKDRQAASAANKRG